MTIGQITYAAEPDNCREVIAWLKERDLFAECAKCHGTGEYEGEHGPRACAACLSRLIAVKSPSGVKYIDWGDTVVFDGYAVEVVRALGNEDL